ncbi:MAG: response regulator [Bacteroidetes bacterium]|nr:response regulator [Bacteroidota bacterium]MDA0903282.1 response regulator [Bacteroidota bacterium]MDA1242159.1 response regulator [Bacteroidota bacterium]
MARYLLIDDDAIIQFVHQRVIAQFDANCEVVALLTSHEATSWLLDHEESLPDFIMLDINMPLQNGFEFLESLEQCHAGLFHKLLRSTRVFLLTSLVNPLDLEQSQTHPMIEGLLSKPLSKEVLASLQDAGV